MPSEETTKDLTEPKAPTLPESEAPAEPVARPFELKPEQLELAAEVVHEALMGYGRARGHNNTAPWDDSPDWQKDAARKAVSDAVSGAPGEDLAPLVARAVVEFLEGQSDAR